jgi:ABC-2 type transport system ATP-binding protein
MDAAAIHIKNLGFTYPGQANMCFSELNLEIPAGQRFGLFGPNGAGKTTLIHCMTGLLSYQQGSILLLGNEMKNQNKSVNKLFGFVPQDLSLYQELSPVENLSFFGAWYGLHSREIKKRTGELLSVLELVKVGKKPVYKFSGGMKRRVNLAVAVMHNPPVLFLDEPTVGVDVQTRYAIITYLKELNRKGTTLIYTSHQLNEAEDLCESIALLDDGKIIADDKLDKLLATHQEDGLEGLFLNLTGKTYRD